VTGLQGKFSAEHAAAVGISDRAGGEFQFSDERVNDPMVSRLRSKVELRFDEELGPYQIRLTVRTTDGRTLSHFVADQKGDHKNPLSWDELVAKFKANASTLLPAENVEELVEMFGDFTELEDVRHLTGLCRGRRTS
jgi:2-methylcitrate dehydratase PrpD